jgi:hypothetical protein
MRGDRRQRDVYDELLRTYEGRWKEIKDEARQALVTVRLLCCCGSCEMVSYLWMTQEVFLGAKEDLLQLDECHMA